MKKLLCVPLLALMLLIPTTVAAAGDRLTLGHVTLTLPGAVDSTDVSAQRDAMFNCNSGPSTCVVDVLFMPQVVRPWDRRQAGMDVKTALRSTLDDDGFYGTVYTTRDYTTYAGQTGSMTLYVLHNSYGVGYIVNSFVMADGGGNARIIEFMYRGSVDTSSFMDGQSDWYAMIDGTTTHGG